jgi:hypothetical protein
MRASRRSWNEARIGCEILIDADIDDRRRITGADEFG